MGIVLEGSVTLESNDMWGNKTILSLVGAGQYFAETYALLPDEEAEDALNAAKRELREETGYVSDEWKKLLIVPSNATIADNYAYLYFADNCKKLEEQELDETEFLNVYTLSEQEIEELIHSGKFEQAMHITAWYLAKEAK